MIQNDFTIHIRRAESGDEACLAHVQTESWKAAFAGIVPAELLAQCTSIERAEKMYARLLAEQQGNGYILELDGKPHCVAWWDAAREEDMPGAAELRCIHSLPGDRRAKIFFKTLLTIRGRAVILTVTIIIIDYEAPQ